MSRFKGITMPSGMVNQKDETEVRKMGLDVLKALNTIYDELTEITTDAVSCNTGNGHGSVGNKIRRYTNSTTIGRSMVYNDSDINGMSITITQAGVYSIEICDAYTISACTLGVSLNSSQLTTDIAFITHANLVIRTATAAANGKMFASTVIVLNSADIIRVHDDGQPNATAQNDAFFRIRKIGI